MKISKAKFLLFFLFTGLAGAAVFGKQDPVIIGETTNRDLQAIIQTDTTSQQINFLTIEKIMEGQEKLKKSSPLKFVEKITKKRLRSGKSTTTTEFLKKEVALAVLDTKTGEVFEKRYWLDEKEVENDNFAYFSEQTGDNYSDMVYVPYSPELHRQEFVEIGKNLMDKKVAEAFRKLRSLGVKSKAFPEKLVADSIEEKFVKTILLTEQTDPSMILLSEDDGKKLVERVLIRLALNGERAYRYTFSKTGASGLGQIMPKTYKSVNRSYPEAKLITDTDIGRIEVVNAIMASVLVFDDHIKDAFRNLTKSQKAKLDKKLAVEPDFINEVRAAVYNGGASKYRPATATIYAGVRETVLFVRKYKMIRELKLFK